MIFYSWWFKDVKNFNFNSQIRESRLQIQIPDGQLAVWEMSKHRSILVDIKLAYGQIISKFDLYRISLKSTVLKRNDNFETLQI